MSPTVIPRVREYKLLGHLTIQGTNRHQKGNESEAASHRLTF